MRGLALLPLAILVATPAAAQRRDLPVPAGKGWQHAASGIVLTATLAGLARTSLTEYGTAERDVAAEFASADRATIATLYIYRPALMSVPMWFDRSQTALELRDTYHGVTPVEPQPTAFARPGGSAATGLRQSYVPASGPFKATALAVVPVGEWLVAIRLSSTALDPAAAKDEMSAILAAIRWPATPDTQPVAVPVKPCTRALEYRNARLSAPNMMQALLGSAIAGMALKKGKEAGTPAQVPTLWCRDPIKPTLEYGVYRGGEGRDGYTLAVADSGRVANVYKGFDLPGEAGAGGYAVSYGDLDGSVATFPSFDALPRPEQVVRLVLGGKPIARTNVTGDQTDISVAPSR